MTSCNWVIFVRALWYICLASRKALEVAVVNYYCCIYCSAVFIYTSYVLTSAFSCVGFYPRYHSSNAFHDFSGAPLAFFYVEFVRTGCCSRFCALPHEGRFETGGGLQLTAASCSSASLRAVLCHVLTPHQRRLPRFSMFLGGY